MPEDPFLLVSLEESESKELAKVISNKTSRKILDLLSKKDATETEIAKKLKVPLSTVHYNIQHLLKANLIKVDEFHYSEKGKEVNHYSLANKLIIIAPKKTTRETFMQKLKGILPVGLIALATAGVIKLITMFRLGATRFMAAAPTAVEKGAEEAGVLVAERGADLIAQGAGAVGNVTPPALPATESIEPVIQIIQAPETNIALWFLIGAAFVIFLLVIWYWLVTKKRKDNYLKR